MTASIIVVAHAGLGHLEDSLGSLADESVRCGAEVILVDNGSADSCGEAAVRRWPWVEVVRTEVNLGFAGGVGLGADAAGGDVLILLNDDAAADEGFVDAHLEVLADHPEAAVSAGERKTFAGAAAKLRDLITRHGVQLIADERAHVGDHPGQIPGLCLDDAGTQGQQPKPRWTGLFHCF